MTVLYHFSLEQCFGPFGMLPFEKFSEKGLFRHLSHHVFRSPEVQKNMSYESHLFFKMFKVESKFRKCKKKLGRYFSFLR